MRVLIADDDRLVCDLLAEFVTACGHEVAEKVTAGGLAVLRSVTATNPDAVLLDVFMPRCNGLTVCHALRSRNPEAKVVLMSGMAEANHPFVASCRATGFLEKPLRLQAVQQMLERLAH